MDARHINCPSIGTLTVYVQGKAPSGAVTVMTVHDLGCDHSQFSHFINHPNMQGLQDRMTWIHVVVPGQEPDAADFPADYNFPTMQKLAEELRVVLDQLNVKEVVCFGEGAGANILARFGMAYPERVLGLCLLHCTGTTAGFLESIKDKMISRKLELNGMNPSAENYLVLHRFGSAIQEINKLEDHDLKIAIESYQSQLRTKMNPKNLKKFVEAFLKRTNIADNIRSLSCPVLMITGQKSMFNGTTRALHQKFVKEAGNKGKIEFVEVAGVANVLEEKPAKVAECLQYFLQGIGLVSSVKMCNLPKKHPYGRTMSMEEADMPKLLRHLSFSEEERNIPEAITEQ